MFFIKILPRSITKLHSVISNRLTARFFNFRRITSICFILVFTSLGLVNANEPIVVDDAFYTENAYLIPPRIIKRTDAVGEGYYEIQIAPADENGVSYNQFSKIDATNLNGLLLINNPDPDLLGSAGNQNLVFSLTEDLKAKEIYLRISNEGSAGTFFQGLMQVIGRSSHVRVESDAGVVIDDAVFKNMESLYIETHDPNHMLVGPMGMHAYSPVLFNSNYITVTGPIYIPDKYLSFVAQGICGFTKDGRIEELGSLQAVCNESFLNYGSIRVQGRIAIETGAFTNQALWDSNVPWEPTMIEALDPRVRAQPGSLRSPSWPVTLPFHDIEGRTYSKRIAGTGNMYATDYHINITKSDFLNIDGAEFSSYGLSPESSRIYVKGKLLNQYYKAYNQQGYNKEGFDFIPSKINLRDDAVFYSQAQEIINSGSTINVHGNCISKAAIDIIAINAEGSYLNHYLLDKPICNKKCSPPPQRGVYTSINVPAIFTIHGQEAARIAGGAIIEKGSIYATKGNNFDKHAGKHIIEAVAIDPVSERKAIKRVNEIFSGNPENALIQKFDGTAVGSPSRSWGRIGGNYIGGLSTIDTEGGMDILGGADYQAKGLDLKSVHDVNLIGMGESYIDQIINNKNERLLTHGFKMHPSIMKIDGPFKIFITEGSLNLNGAIIVTIGDGIIDTPKMFLVPLTLLEENYYYKKKKNFFNKAEISIKKSVASTIEPGVLAGGHLELNVGHLSNEGGTVEGKQGTGGKIGILDAKAHVINHWLIKQTKNSGIRFPGITNVVIDSIREDFTSKSISENIPIAGALDRVFHTKSASDMAPSISAVVEAYTMADQFSQTYLTTGSEMAAMTSVALDQLGLMMVGNIPVPASISFGTKKTHSKSTWQEAIPATIGGGYIKINANEIFANGAVFKADKDIKLDIAENFHLNTQPLKESERFREEGKFFTLTLNSNGVSASAGGNVAKANSDTIRQILPKIIAGDSVIINVGKHAEVEGVIEATTIKLKVGGELLLKTVQDKGTGGSSQKFANGGVSISSAGITPTGGFQFGNGDWLKNWANQQAGIFGNKVEIDVQKLILEGASILGKMGYVNPESLEFKDLENTFVSEFSEFGFDTNFVRFLINPKNAPKVVAAANAIKGMAVVGSQNEATYQTLYATISQNLEVNTNSDIEGLNRVDSKAEEPVRKSSHKFSLALPVVDWKELGEGLERIDMTARDINQKRIEAFIVQREELLATEPEKAAQWQEVIEGQAKITEIISTSDLPEEKKLELSMRIALLFSGTEPASGQYLVHSTSDLELSDRKKFTPISLQGEQGDLIYSPNNGAIIAIEITPNYGEDTYRYMAQYFDPGTIAEIKEIQSRWKIVAEKIGSGALDFGEGFVMVPIKTMIAVKDSVVIIGGFYVDVMDGTFAKKTEAFNSLGGDDQLEIVKEVAIEMLEEMYENFKESHTTAKGWGGIVGEAAMFGGVARVAKGVKVASKLDGKSAVLEETCSRGIGLGEREVYEFKMGDHSSLVPGGGLAFHEALKGHTLLHHIGKPIDYLKARFIEKPDLKYVSTFYDRYTAEKVISRAIENDNVKIDAWLKNPKKMDLELNYQDHSPLGIRIAKDSDKIENINTCRIVLSKDTNSPLGYYIKTAYPKK